MGFYNDFRSPNRDGWKYDYTGRQLSGPALAKYREYSKRVSAARAKLAAMYADPGERSDSDKMTVLKAEITSCEDHAEKLAVWVHEFRRSPERTFNLHLSDVTFFDLAPNPDLTE